MLAAPGTHLIATLPSLLQYWPYALPAAILAVFVVFQEIRISRHLDRQQAFLRETREEISQQQVLFEERAASLFREVQSLRDSLRTREKPSREKMGGVVVGEELDRVGAREIKLDFNPPAAAARYADADQVAGEFTRLFGGSGPETLGNLIAATYRTKIFYATDREQEVDEEGRYSYSAERSHEEGLHLGTCEVSIPVDHERGKLERPHWWKLEFHEDPLKHVVLLEITPLATDTFFTKLQERITPKGNPKGPKEDVLVFIHGFDVTFEEGARRTAQLAHDLDFKGAPVLYSWPSGGNLGRYPADEATIGWVAPHLKSFLNDLALKSQAAVVHLVAHSMGNRALLQVLHELSLSHATSRFRQVVLTAPDIDTGEFLQIANAIQSTADRITLYASSKDRALAASKKVHKYPRAGEAGENLVVVPGIDTIDATKVSTDFLCHSYFSKERTVITDISYLVKKGLAPNERYGLEERPHRAGPYWEFAE